jgi:hypothetical protein
MLYKYLDFLYNNITRNIILSTYNLNFDLKEIIKYVDKSNLILIPASLHNDIDNAVYDEINKFYYDGNYILNINNVCKRNLKGLYSLYKFMLNNSNKYEYILRIRIDMIFQFNKEIIYELINLSKSNKIVRLSLAKGMSNNHFGRDKNLNFETIHSLNTNTYITTSHTNDYLDFSKYNIFYEFLDLMYKYITYSPNIWQNIENHNTLIYIYAKEKLTNSDFIIDNKNRNVIYVFVG